MTWMRNLGWVESVSRCFRPVRRSRSRGLAPLWPTVPGVFFVWAAGTHFIGRGSWLLQSCMRESQLPRLSALCGLKSTSSVTFLSKFLKVLLINAAHTDGPPVIAKKEKTLFPACLCCVSVTFLKFSSLNCTDRTPSLDSTSQCQLNAAAASI